MGFTITKGQTPFLQVLQENFPDFQLGAYLRGLDEMLRPLTSRPIEKELAYFEGNDPMLLLQYFSDDEADEKTDLGISRAFIRYPDELVATAIFFASR